MFNAHVCKVARIFLRNIVSNLPRFDRLVRSVQRWSLYFIF